VTGTTRYQSERRSHLWRPWMSSQMAIGSQYRSSPPAGNAARVSRTDLPPTDAKESAVRKDVPVPALLAIDERRELARAPVGELPVARKVP
jgi:hypothetical protein